MNSEMKRHGRYATVCNEAIRDESLSIEARGMLVLLMSFANGWRFNADHIAKVCGVGREKYQRMVRELKDAGYLRISARQVGGTLDGYLWEIDDRPNRWTENPSDGGPAPIRKPTGKNTKKEENQSLELPEPEGLIALDELWKIYPHPKNRGAKPDAAFKKLKKDEREKFRDAIPAMKAKLEADHARGFDRQAPMFATYLNQRRFMTELEGDDAPAAGRRDRRYLTGETLRIDGE